MTRVKICGITRVQDALAAAEAGADAIGLVFAESPRRVTIEQARAIVAQLPPFVAAVGVFAKIPIEEVAATARAVGLSEVQVHDDFAPAAFDALGQGTRVIKAFRVRDGRVASSIRRYPHVNGLHLDAYVEGMMGGTGKRIDGEVMSRLLADGVLNKPWVLAGGLNPQNVAEALLAYRPHGVDVSSGVEERPGVKDIERVRAFIRTVRGFERG